VNNIKIPRYIDANQVILFRWTFDELAIFGTFFIIGIITGHPTIGMGIGMVAVRSFSRYRNTKPDGFLLHVMYWWGFVPLKNRSALNAFHRRILPS
jgi:conjugal transfer pilus assembly protein TraL